MKNELAWLTGISLSLAEIPAKRAPARFSARLAALNLKNQ